MRYGKRAAVISCLVVLTAIGGVGCGKPAELKFRPTAGETRVLRLASKQTITMDSGGQALPGVPQGARDSSNRLNYEFNCENVAPDGQAAMKVTFADVLVDMSGGMGAMGGAGESGDMGLNGKSFSMTVNGSGEVSGVTGMAPIVEEITKKTTEDMKKKLSSMPGMETMMKSMLDNIGTQMARAFGDTAMTEEMGNLFSYFPEQPIKPGMTWTRKEVRNFGMGMPMIEETSYKLVKRENGKLTVESNTKISPNPDAKGMDFGMGTIKMNPTGESSGTMGIDEKTGWVLSADLKQKVDCQMEIKLSGELAKMAGAAASLPKMSAKIDGDVTMTTEKK